MNAQLELLQQVLEELDPEAFIEADPLSIPKRFSKKEDQEIAGFFAANLAWGQRKMIIRQVNILMGWMEEDPHAFILNASESEMERFSQFVYRTFQGVDAVYFMRRLARMYRDEGGIEAQFGPGPVKKQLEAFHALFFDAPDAPQRSRKHLADPGKGSAAKRMNLYLRWMVRKDAIDLGIWDQMEPAQLICPLDVHVRRSAQFLGLLKRNSSDWKAAEELTDALRELDPKDPVRFDLPLFLLSETGRLTV